MASPLKPPSSSGPFFALSDGVPQPSALQAASASQAVSVKTVSLAIEYFASSIEENETNEYRSALTHHLSHIFTSFEGNEPELKEVIQNLFIFSLSHQEKVDVTSFEKVVKGFLSDPSLFTEFLRSVREGKGLTFEIQSMPHKHFLEEINFLDFLKHESFIEDNDFHLLLANVLWVVDLNKPEHLDFFNEVLSKIDLKNERHSEFVFSLYQKSNPYNQKNRDKIFHLMRIFKEIDPKHPLGFQLIKKIFLEQLKCAVSDRSSALTTVPDSSAEEASKITTRSANHELVALRSKEYFWELVNSWLEDESNHQKLFELIEQSNFEIGYICGVKFKYISDEYKEKYGGDSSASGINLLRIFQSIGKVELFKEFAEFYMETHGRSIVHSDFTSLFISENEGVLEELIANGLPLTEKLVSEVLLSQNYESIFVIMNHLTPELREEYSETILTALMELEDTKLADHLLVLIPSLGSKCSIALLEKAVKNSNQWFVDFVIDEIKFKPEQIRPLFPFALSNYNLRIIKQLCKKLPPLIYEDVLRIRQIKDRDQLLEMLTKYAIMSPLEDVYELKAFFPDICDIMPDVLKRISLTVRFPNASLAQEVAGWGKAKTFSIGSYLIESIEYLNRNLAVLSRLVPDLKQLRYPDLLNEIVRSRCEKDPRCTSAYLEKLAAGKFNFTPLKGKVGTSDIIRYSHSWKHMADVDDTC